MSEYLLVDDHSYHVALWPLVLAGVGLVLSLAMGALLSARPRGLERAPRRRLAVALSLLGGVLGSVLVASSPLVFSMLGLVRDQVSYLTGRTGLGEFLPYIFAGTLMPVVAILSTSMCLSLHLGRTPTGARSFTLPAVGGLALGALLMLGGFVEVQMLVLMGQLPYLTDDVQRRVHVGRQVIIEPRVAGVRDPSRWSTADLTLTPAKPGLVVARVEAKRFPVTVRWEVRLEAGEDRPDPLLPLSVGNHWVFRRTERWTDTVMVVKDITHEQVSDPVRFEVTAESTVDGLHVFEITRTSKDAEPVTTRLYGWNGTNVTIDGAPFGAPVAADSGSSTHARLSKLLGQDDVVCKTGLFPSFTCLCLSRPRDEARIPGPVLCIEDPSSTDGLKGLAQFMFGLATAGMVAPSFDRDESWKLVESGSDASP